MAKDPDRCTATVWHRNQKGQCANKAKPGTHLCGTHHRKVIRALLRKGKKP